MESARTPKVLRLLDTQRNLAADTAIVESLSQLDEPALTAALDVLVRRGHEPALCAVIARFGSFNRLLQTRVVERAPAFSGALRLVIEAPDIKARAGAVAVIAHSGYTHVAMLLADALRSEDRQTRRLAGDGLYRFGVQVVAEASGGQRVLCAANGGNPAGDVGKALARAIHLWDIHRLPRLVEAALWFPEWTMSAVCRKLEDPHKDILRPIMSILSGKPGPKLAAFVVRALGVPQLQSTASELIGKATDLAFVRAVLDHTWLLADRAIGRGLRRCRSLHWVSDEAGILDALDDDRCRNAVRWVAGLPGTAGERTENLRDLARWDHERLADTVAWALLDDSSSESTTLLRELTGRLTGGAGRCVVAALRRGTSATSRHPAHTGRPGESPATGATEAFGAYWDQFEPANEEKMSPIRGHLLRFASQLPALVRERLAFGEASHRRKALSAIRDLGLTEVLAENVYRSAFDADPAVRGMAVSLLIDLEGVTSARILAQALNDSDHRVQANAIDVLDRWHDPDRTVIAKPKLASEHNRVRANAIKSLLPLEDLEAGAALLEMLDHPSRRHRVSALWVVGRLKLRTLVPRIVSMASTDQDRRIRKLATDLSESLRTSP